MGDYRKLMVWERAHRLALEVYRATGSFPREETYGLTSQLRRSASSIPANLAEGCGRNRDTELARFSEIAMGSANELDYHRLLACDLGFLQRAVYQRLSAEARGINNMLATLIHKLRPSRRPIADSR